MKFIDEKGRLLGVINLIDFFVLILVAVLIGSFIVNLPLSINNKKSAPLMEEKFIRVLYRIPDEVLENKKILNPGDMVLSKMATIEKVLKVTRNAPALETDIVSSYEKSTGYSNVVVLIRANCMRLRDGYYCANIPIKINSYLTISSEFYALNGGIVLGIDKSAGADDR